MAKLSHLLSDLQLKRWIAKGEPVARTDGDGLTFTLSRSGTATWVLRYSLPGGRRRELTIGNYPDLTLAGARERARELRAKIDRGDDPAAEKQEQKARTVATWTFRELVVDYREKILTPGKYAADTIRYRNDDLNQTVLPALGSWRVDKITSIDIVNMLRNAKRTWTISKRTLTSASMAFDHACGLSIIAANPCTGIKLNSIMGARPRVRSRLMLTTDEITKLLQGIDDIGRENALAFRILLATCVRGFELINAKKDHIDLKKANWWIPPEVVKTRAGFLVPLAPPVVEWFRELIALSGDSQWLLPSRRMDRVTKMGDVPVGRTTLWAAFNRAFLRGDIDIRRFTPHDTRSTAKGHLRNMGVSREISEIALNHALKGMEAIYDVREEIPERRNAMRLWADFIVACELGEPPPPERKEPRLRLVA